MRFARASRLIAGALVAVGLARGAQAQAVRTFVSVSGSDANPCTPAAPCRTFTAALALTAAGGEVVAVSSGGYGPVVIDKPVQIIAAPGVYAAITASTGTAVLVRGASAALDGKVVLRGLTLNSLGAERGILAVASRLHLENCMINGFQTGVEFSSVDGTLFIKDTVVRNGPGLSAGIRIRSRSRAHLERVRVENHDRGVEAQFGTETTIRDSVLVGNGFGIEATTDAVVSVEGCLFTYNQTGVQANGPGVRIRVADSAIVQNMADAVVTLSGGQVLTRLDNLVEGNRTDGTFTGTFSER